MSTIKLENAIQVACVDLTWIYETLARIRTSGTLSDESYRFFELSAELTVQLQHARDMLSVRDVALAAAQTFPTRVGSAPDRFLFSGVEVTFKQGRFLLFQNYLATTWALYDSLAKVSGILCCVDERAKKSSKPIKLPEDFLRGQKCVGARVHDHLKGSYGWPVGISYAVRNWLVHDGHSQNGVELFKFDSPNSAPFEISDGALDKILSKCTEEYKSDRLQTRLRPFPELHRDLLVGIEKCNDEVDEAMEFVLLWAAGAVRLQARILFARDSGLPPSATSIITRP
jgi:hypothetical protein